MENTLLQVTNAPLDINHLLFHNETTHLTLQKYLESYQLKFKAIQHHELVQIETIINLLHSRLSNDKLPIGEYERNSDTDVLVNTMIYMLGGERVDQQSKLGKHKIIPLENKYCSQPLSLEKFLEFKNYNRNKFYRDIVKMKMYYNNALEMAIASDCIPIDWEYKYKTLFKILESNKQLESNANLLKIHDYLYDSIVLKSKKLSLKTKVSDEIIIADPLSENIIQGPFDHIKDFQRIVAEYFNINHRYPDDLLELQDHWENDHLKIVSNHVMMKNPNYVVHKGSFLLLKGQFNDEFGGLTCQYDDETGVQKFMVSKENNESHSWFINEYGFLESKGN